MLFRSERGQVWSCRGWEGAETSAPLSPAPRPRAHARTHALPVNGGSWKPHGPPGPARPFLSVLFCQFKLSSFHDMKHYSTDTRARHVPCKAPVNYPCFGNDLHDLESVVMIWKPLGLYLKISTKQRENTV